MCQKKISIWGGGAPPKPIRMGCRRNYGVCVTIILYMLVGKDKAPHVYWYFICSMSLSRYLSPSRYLCRSPSLSPL